jgi:hypothetical protein
MQVAAVDPDSDIAALACADPRQFLNDARAFNEFRKATKPVRVSTHGFDALAPEPVHVFAHEGKWVTAIPDSRRNRDDAPVWLNFEEKERVVLGAPVIDGRGRLVGVCVTWLHRKGRCVRMCRPQFGSSALSWSANDALARIRSVLAGDERDRGR